MTSNALNKRPKYIICLRVLFAILTVLVAALIFYMSSQDSGTSSNTSGKVIVKIISTIDNTYKTKTPAEQRFIVRSLQKIVRKTAHFCIYGALGAFFASFVSTFKMRFWGKFLISFVFCSLYAVSDEIHQNFVSGRSCELRDMLIDSGGSLCGIFFVLFLVFLCVRRKEVKTSMRKRELLRQNERLTEKILEADKLIESLKNTLKDKENEIEILKEKLISADSKAVKQLDETEETAVEIVEETAPITEETQLENSVEPKDYSDFDFALQPSFKKDSDISEYAVKTIGKIVTESVKINCVLASSMCENKKELINLVLGRTEVAKEEISSILTTDLNADLLKTSIDKECAETLDYFQSILGQI